MFFTRYSKHKILLITVFTVLLIVGLSTLFLWQKSNPSPVQPQSNQQNVIKNNASKALKSVVDVEDIDDVQEIISKIEKLVEVTDGRDKGAVSVEVSNELHGIILHGTIKNGLFINGVVCS